MTSFDSSTENQDTQSWTLRLVLLVVLGISGALISHRWDASLRFNENQGLLAHERENLFVDSQGEATVHSAIGYLLLGTTGALCLIGSKWNHLRWLHPLSILFSSFFAWALVSLLWSDFPVLSIRKASILLLVTLAAYGIASRANLMDIMWVAMAYFGAALLVGIASEISHGVFRPWATGYRLTGTQHPNSIGMNASILCLAAGLLAFQYRSSRLLLSAVVGFGFVVLLLSKSRTSLAAFGVAVLIVALLKTPAQFRLMVGSLAIAVASVVGIAFNFVSSQDVSNVSAAASLGRNDDVGSLTGRLPLWHEMLKSADEHLFLGVGYGSFWNASRIDQISEKLRWEIPNGHNAYLDLLLNVGLVGLLLYVAWLVALVVTGSKRYSASGYLGELFVVGVVTFLTIHALAESLMLALGVPSLLLLACSARLALFAPDELARVGSVKSALAEGASSTRPFDQLVTKPQH